MPLTIKKAKTNEIKLIHALLADCGEDMFNRYNLSHWYPFMDIYSFKSIMQDKYLYTVYDDEDLVATFNISPTSRDYYYESLWQNPNHRAAYLGQLAIRPKKQGGGLGKWCMQQVEDIVKEMKLETIRFDALEKHPWLTLFYLNLGYKPGGIVKPANWNLVCFEKILTK